MEYLYYKKASEDTVTVVDAREGEKVREPIVPFTFTMSEGLREKVQASQSRSQVLGGLR